MKIEVEIGEILKERGRSRYWLARRVGISDNSVTRWVRGLRSVNLDILARICEALECEPGDLLRVSETKRKRS
jgi:putative transcriptional regulator